MLRLRNLCCAIGALFLALSSRAWAQDIEAEPDLGAGVEVEETEVEAERDPVVEPDAEPDPEALPDPEAGLSGDAGVPHRTGAEIDTVVEAGAAWTYARADYQSDDGSDSVDENNAVGPAGAVHFVVTGRLGDVVSLGGFFRMAVAGVPFPFASPSLYVQVSTVLGPTLRFSSTDPSGGPFGGIWFGFVGTVDGMFGFAGGFDVGYRWRIAERWAIELAGAVSTQWTFELEPGDFGEYSYTNGSVWPTVQLRFANTR